MFIIGRWVATSALPPLDKLYRRRPLFEEAAYWFTAAVCNALLTACVITEEDRSGKYENQPDEKKDLYPETIDLQSEIVGFCIAGFRCLDNSAPESHEWGCEGETSRALAIPIEMVPLLPGDSELLSQMGFCDPSQNALALDAADGNFRSAVHALMQQRAISTAETSEDGLEVALCWRIV